jgi:hypothetical protein
MVGLIGTKGVVGGPKDADCFCKQWIGGGAGTSSLPDTIRAGEYAMGSKSGVASSKADELCSSEASPQRGASHAQRPGGSEESLFLKFS